MEVLEVENCPDATLAKTNRAILNPTNSFARQGVQHIAVREAPKGKEAFIFSVAYSNLAEANKICFNLTSRKWAKLIKGKHVEVAPYLFDPITQCLDTVTFSVDFNVRDKAPTNTEFDVIEMAKQFSVQFRDQAFTVGQLFGFSFNTNINNTKVVFELTVKNTKSLSLDGMSQGDDAGTSQIDDAGKHTVEIGLSTANTNYLFERGDPSVKLTGGSTNLTAPRVISQNWDFQAMGVGGLSDQFQKIFRRAFASRLLPPSFAEKIKAEFVKGILLYGPPGTGKTLIARQIGKMLLSREPKVVNGPEVLNKYVGESEANIRKLFQEAEDEYKKEGSNSGLHVIIFDEIDAICKARGTSAGSAGVGDNIVNQLLSKIDGVNALPNVLLIGMTNRRDLIDEAMLRPGRLELQIEIGVPNLQGRLEILKIHTSQLEKNKLLDPSISLEELAEKTKNYTGAELAGLVRAARDMAVNRIIKVDSKVEITQEMLDGIKLLRSDFQFAMENDIKPALGASEDELSALARTIIPWDAAIDTIQSNFKKIIADVTDQSEIRTKPRYVLILGEPKSGLTTIAANLASQSGFPFVRVYKAAATAGKPESVKIQYLEKLFADAARSEQSCVIIDNLANIVNYSRIGPQFSIGMRHVLESHNSDNLPPNRKMLVVITCNKREVIDALEIEPLFKDIIRVPSLERPEHVQAVLSYLMESGECPFTKEQIDELMKRLGSIPFKMGIEILLDIIAVVGRRESDSRVKIFLERMYQLNLVIRSRKTDLF